MATGNSLQTSFPHSWLEQPALLVIHPTAYPLLSKKPPLQPNPELRLVVLCTIRPLSTNPPKTSVAQSALESQPSASPVIYISLLIYALAGNTQAKSHATSAKIKCTKARKARQALRKKKRAVASPNLSKTDWDNDDDDEEDGSDNNSAEAEEVYGEDQGEDEADYEPKTLGCEDTDIDYKASCERELLFKRLHEALDKDFSHHKTDELHSLWKAHCKSEEADEELEVEYPQIKNLGTLVVTTTGDSQADPAGPSEPERRSKRAVDNQLAGSSKRVRLSNNPQANPSAIEPPSSQPPSIAPPSFPTAPEPTSRVAYRKPNAPSPSAHPDGPRPSAPTPLARFPTAATLVDNPKTTTARSPPPPPPWVPTPDPRQPPPAPRPLARPTAPAPTPRSAAPASGPAAPAPAPAPAPRPPAPAPAPCPSASVSRPATPASTSAPRPAAPISHPPAPTPTPAPCLATPVPTSSSRAGAPSSTSFIPTSRAGSSRLPPVPEVEQEPGVQPRARAPAYTNLMEDCAEPIAETEVSCTGRPAARPKTKPCARNYFGDQRMLIAATVKRQFALAIVECAYGNRGWMIILSREAWQDVFQHTLPEKELTYPDDDYFAMVANRGATNCGEVLKHVRPIGHSMGDFIDPPMTDEDAQHNIEQVKVLLLKLFHYERRDPPSHPYEHLGIMRVIAAGLFHSRSSVGAANIDLFGMKDGKMLLPAVAFITTNLHVSIAEFSTGRRQTTDLNAGQRYDIYVDHAHGLEAYARRAPHLMAQMQRKWFNFCKAYAGITDKADEDQEARHDIYDDIPPDVPGLSSPEPADEPLPPFNDLAPPAEPAEPPEPLLLEPYFPPLPPPGMLSRAGLLLDADGWERYDNKLLYGDQELDNEPKPEDELEPKPEPEPEFERKYDGHSRLTAHAKGKGRAPPQSTRPSNPRPSGPSRPGRC
ncbi:hypothetical protein FRC07_010969 [Ceratobasidium sp. 392]|nr:hypothetical protein FRC07_010969 [Ceratobasidium sp. 392]